MESAHATEAISFVVIYLYEVNVIFPLVEKSVSVNVHFFDRATDYDDGNVPYYRIAQVVRQNLVENKAGLISRLFPSLQLRFPRLLVRDYPCTSLGPFSDILEKYSYCLIVYLNK